MYMYVYVCTICVYSMCVCVYVCMYVCMYVCIDMYVCRKINNCCGVFGGGVGVWVFGVCVKLAYVCVFCVCDVYLLTIQQEMVIFDKMDRLNFASDFLERHRHYKH